MAPDLGSILLMNLFLALGVMALAWLVSLVKKDAGVADIFWGLGFVVLAWATLLHSEGHPPRALLLAVLLSLWGLRLSSHILVRSWGRPEDPRYQGLRRKGGRLFWIKSLFSVFGLQGFILWVIALALQVGAASPAPARWTWMDTSGLVLWAAGFGWEAVADWQLSRFKADPENSGRVMNQGLWAYSRHPNYFGESLVWWGIFLIALSVPFSWWTLLSPITITYLLLKVSGVGLLERTITKRRPGYEAYIRETNAFFPWFRRKA